MQPMSSPLGSSIGRVVCSLCCAPVFFTCLHSNSTRCMWVFSWYSGLPPTFAIGLPSKSVAQPMKSVVHRTEVPSGGPVNYLTQLFYFFVSHISEVQPWRYVIFQQSLAHLTWFEKGQTEDWESDHHEGKLMQNQGVYMVYRAHVAFTKAELSGNKNVMRK